MGARHDKQSANLPVRPAFPPGRPTARPTSALAALHRRRRDFPEPRPRSPLPVDRRRAAAATCPRGPEHYSGSMSLSARNARAAELFTVPGAHPRRSAISASVRSS